MTRQGHDWDAMLHALEAFKKEQGHCRVPALWAKNPALGRWVAKQRFQHKLGVLPSVYVDKLNKIGFVWTPSDIAWTEMYERLVQYRARYGDCRVPTSNPSDPVLARWVATQRARRSRNALLPERVQKLDAIGFVWAIYTQDPVAKENTDGAVAPAPVRLAPRAEAHLYQVGGVYLQYDGTGPRPAKLEQYMQRHGEMPPSIVLAREPAVFRIEHWDSGCLFTSRYTWSGQGPIPDEVLAYLNENGTLPPHG